MIKDQSPTEKASKTINIFLCHSTDDRTVVHDLYQRLLEDGFRPWLYEKDILPGQDWNYETTLAVRKSDIVLICLSQKSIIKRGYVQKEIKHALDIANEQPFGGIFLIPLRLEPCEIPDQLSKWQWVNYYEEDGYEKLKRALDTVPRRPVPAHPRPSVEFTLKYSQVPNPALNNTSKPSLRRIPFLVVPLACFLLGATLLSFMIWSPEKVVALGLIGRVRYIVPLVLGFSVAVFLFGVLDLYSTYRGRQLSFLMLSGLVAVFFLTVVLGFMFIPKPSTFRLTVWVRGTGGLPDTVLKNSGEVVVNLDGDRRLTSINNEGQAIFQAVPVNFLGHEVPISLISDKFESIQSKVTLDVSRVYLAVRGKSTTPAFAQPCPPVNQTSTGPGSPNVQCVNGDVTITVDQNSEKAESLQPSAKTNRERRTDQPESISPKSGAHQTSTGAGSPNVQGAPGKVNISIDQRSSKSPR
ncbi:MAG TPA: TIR domain-containing protein [Candidatus Angelobacter sp.]|jgi:hypothetical protein|nr:TIR domain-containing protein [Candidatus Angelobacter sp.]